MTTLILTGVPFFAQAGILDLLGIGDITSTVVMLIVGGIGYIFGFITSMIFTLGGWLVSFALNINLMLLESPIVTSGWSIVLSFTNLGFVLAIIVIAFATILRIETYALKQTLWKLIVAALLVNFSLVIAGAFVNISHTATDLFLAKATLRGEGITKFSDTLANSLGVQAFLKVKDDAVGFAGIFNEFGSATLSIVGSLFFIAFFTFIGALTFLTIAIMLAIRYVILGILLILSPIVWLMWIFPTTKKYWQEWWTTFIRWTFFAPIMLFFLYLAVLTLNESGQRYKKLVGENTAAATANISANSPFTFGFDVIGNLVMVVGLMLGGLFVANKLGIVFADTAYGWAEGGSKMFGQWVGRKGKQYGTDWLRKKGTEEGAKSRAERTQEWAKARKTKLGKFAAGWISQGAAKLTAVGGEDLVKQAKERIKDMTLLQKKAALLTADVPTETALLEDLGENKNLTDVDMAKYLTNAKKAQFIKFGRGLQFNNSVEKVVGINTKMMEALKSNNIAVFGEEADKFYKTYRAEHFNKMQVDDFFGEKIKFGLDRLDKKTVDESKKRAAQAVLQAVPDGIANIYRGMKKENLDYFHDKNLWAYIEGQAGSKDEKIIADWLKKNQPKLYNFYTSFTAHSLGIGIEPVKEEKKEEKKA